MSSAFVFSWRRLADGMLTSRWICRRISKCGLSWQRAPRMWNEYLNNPFYRLLLQVVFALWHTNMRPSAKRCSGTWDSCATMLWLCPQPGTSCFGCQLSHICLQLSWGSQIRWGKYGRRKCRQVSAADNGQPKGTVCELSGLTKDLHFLGSSCISTSLYQDNRILKAV